MVLASSREEQDPGLRCWERSALERKTGLPPTNLPRRERRCQQRAGRPEHESSRTSRGSLRGKKCAHFPFTLLLLSSAPGEDRAVGITFCERLPGSCRLTSTSSRLWPEVRCSGSQRHCPQHVPGVEALSICVVKRVRKEESKLLKRNLYC